MNEKGIIPMVKKPSDLQHEHLLRAAQRVAQHSYSPYSKFKVGAALIDEKGKIHIGTNVENASYGATICAERSAICAMIANGGKRILAIAIATSKGAPPCGLCRQTLGEFASPSTPIIVATLKKSLCVFSLSDLLPAAFGPQSLKTTPKFLRNE